MSATQGSRRDYVYYDDDYDSFWWSQTGQIVRWAMFGGFFLAVILFLTLGYIHAKRRVRNGLPPLRYHRWMLSRQRAAIDPNYIYRDQVPNYSTYHQEHYGMHAFPPPVYDPNSAPPPQYQPPAGVTKVDPSQARGESSRPAPTGPTSPRYAPPLGPPPADAVQTNPTGSSSVSNNPFRQ